MAHVAIAARLDTLAAHDRRTANALQTLAHSTGSSDEEYNTLIEKHRSLADELEALASRNRINDM